MAPKKTAAVKATAVAKKDIKPKKEKKVKDPNAVSPFSDPRPETTRNVSIFIDYISCAVADHHSLLCSPSVPHQASSSTQQPSGQH